MNPRFNRTMRVHVVLALVIAACAGRAIRHDPHEGMLQLTFHNLAGGSICEVYVFPATDTNEGANRLANELRSGEQLRLWLVPGDYQVREDGCTFEKLDVKGFTTNIRLNMNGNVVLYREDDAKSKAAATQFAHDNENTYLVVAKVQLVKHPTPRNVDAEKPPL